jgi:hypothetical protein
MAKKQAELPGMETPRIEELETAIETFFEKRQAWTKAGVELKDAKAMLAELGKKHGITTYRDETANPPLVLALVEREPAVKVTEMAPELDDEEQEQPFETEAHQ